MSLQSAVLVNAIYISVCILVFAIVAPTSSSLSSVMFTGHPMFQFPTIPTNKIQDQIRNITKSVPVLRIGQSRPMKIHIHCIVLVHGWMGNSKELSYLQSQLIKEGGTTANSKSPLTYFLTYPSIVNEGRTSDGISNGGQRLAYEINTWMHTLRQQIRHDNTLNNSNDIQYHMSFSLIGNSLGGLYARYALRDIQFHPHHQDINCTTPDRLTQRSSSSSSSSLSLPFYPAIFATTCTPHLGVGRDQSFVPFLPSWIQISIAQCIGPTGYDLFRRTPKPTTTTTTSNATERNVDVIQETAFREEFIQPLQSFHRRIALCNTYRTDLQVPCSTAAFLISPTTFVQPCSSDELLSNHMRNDEYYHRSDWNDRLRNTPPNIGKSCVSLIVETAATTKTRSSSDEPTTRTSNDIAYQLDSLGWMKIFCDTRPYLPYIPMGTDLITSVLHFFLHTMIQYWNRIVPWWSTKREDVTDITNSEENMTTRTSTTSIQSPPPPPPNPKETFSTHEIWNRYILDDDNQYCDTGLCDDDHHRRHHQQQEQYRHQNRWYLPFGHTIVVANAKNDWYGRMNAAGQPTMDQFAKLLVQEILQSTMSEK